MAVSFNGSSDVILMGNVSPLTIANNAPFAVSCWVNFASISGVPVLIAKGFDVAGDIAPYELFLDASTPKIGFQSVDTGGTVGHGTSATVAWSTGQWHHIYGDYTGAGGTPASTWRLYLDGSPASSAFDTTGPINNSEQFSLGALRTSTASFQNFLNGCMADAAVYNGPLTGTEITNLGNGTLRPNTGMSQTLLGYWKLDTVWWHSARRNSKPQ